MSLTIPAATARLGRELHTAESAIGQALVATTALLHTSALARADNPQIDPACGQAALMRMHKSLGNLLSAHGDMLRAHHSLKDDAKVYAGADEPTCPDRYGFTGAELEEVEKALRSA